MKTDDPAAAGTPAADPERADEPTAMPGKDSTANDRVSASSEETASATNGVGSASAASAAGRFPGEGGAPSHETAPAKRSRILRFAYWFLWFVLTPIVLASLAIWALTPPSSADLSGAFGWVQSVVRSQPVPVGIVLFTVFEVALWAARHQLPFARHAHPPLRADLPSHARAQFERARALLDEAEMILGKHEKAVVRELTAKERDRLRAHLTELRDTMDRVPFDEDAFMSSLEHALGEVDLRLSRWRKSEVREYVEAILMAVAVAFALRAFVIEAFKIPSGSMIPTLMVGDHIFVNKFSYGPAIPFTHARVWENMPPHRGDVMVFAFPEHPEQDFIKRVIALPGDKLEAKSGHPVINGWTVPSCRVGAWSYEDIDSGFSKHEGDLYVEFLGDEAYLTFFDHFTGAFAEDQGPYFAKKGEVWVMGDNRNNSHDSRMWFQGRGGGVPFENIRGRALFVWLSMNEGIDMSREGAPVMGAARLPPSASALQAQLDECLKKRPATTNPPPPSQPQPLAIP